MRIWDIPPSKLCRNHLLGEHRELHAIWSILVNNKKGYSKHPETLRWKGKLNALYSRHGRLVTEMERRGYSHHTSLAKRYATGKPIQNVYVDSPIQQLSLLKRKKCGCRLR